jgi:hypothetical protein
VSGELGRGTETARAVDDGAAQRGRPGRFALSSSSPRPARVVSPHAGKFRLATGFLLGLGLAALIIAAALASQPNSSARTGRWSAWAPNESGKLGATEIAEHVAPYYRLTSAAQLDVVTLINLANPNTAQTSTTPSSGLTVAVNTGSSGSSSSLSLLGGSTIAYNLCGTGGHDCQLPGTPSAGRMLLLRREALELALYTFKYISGTDNVICVLPPGRTQVTSTLSPKLPSAKASSSNSTPVTVAVVFLRQELQPWLQQPLSSTLGTIPPPVSELPLWQKTQEAGLVDQITAHGLFSEQIESQQTGGNLLVLNQLPPQ